MKQEKLTKEIRCDNGKKLEWTFFELAIQEGNTFETMSYMYP